MRDGIEGSGIEGHPSKVCETGILASGQLLTRIFEYQVTGLAKLALVFVGSAAFTSGTELSVGRDRR